jgi:hypothetical protein
MWLSHLLNTLPPFFTHAGSWNSPSKEYGLKPLAVTAFESAHILATPDHSPRCKHCTRNKRLADSKDTFPDRPIKGSIGGDNYWKLIKDSPHYALLILWSYCHIFSCGFSVAIDREFQWIMLPLITSRCATTLTYGTASYAASGVSELWA